MDIEQEKAHATELIHGLDDTQLHMLAGQLQEMGLIDDAGATGIQLDASSSQQPPVPVGLIMDTIPAAPVELGELTVQQQDSFRFSFVAVPHHP